MEKANAVYLIERLCRFEVDFKLQKQEFKDKYNIDPIRHPQLDSQINEWSKQMMISFKHVLVRVLVYFAEDNEDANGYAKDVNEMVIRNLVGNPEENLTNLLMGTEEEEEDGNFPDGGGLANLREVKVEEIDRNSTEVVLPPNSDNQNLNQMLSSSHPINQGSSDLVLSSLDTTQTQSTQLVTPVLQQQNVNNVIQQPTNLKKKRTMWKKLSIQPSHCMVRGCGKAYDYERIRSKHISKHHKKTVNWSCAKCTQQFRDYSQLSDHYFREHLDQFQCTFQDCGFTGKTARQVSRHFEEQHNDVSDLVDNLEGDPANPDTDEEADHNDANDDMTEQKTNSEENVQPINQGSTGFLQSSQDSSVTSNDDSNIGPVNVVQMPSICAEPKTLKRTSPEPGNNEECNKIAVTSQGPVGIVDDKDQSSASAKKAKFDEPKKPINTQKRPKFNIIRGRWVKREAAYCRIYNDDIEDANQRFRNGTMLKIVNRTCSKCFHCQRLFNTMKKLNRHKWNKHSIRAFPCLVKDCGQSFDTKSIRFKHVRKDHDYSISQSNTVRLHCAKCPQDFSIYGKLTEHYLTVHSARYECAIPNCEFTSGFVDTAIQHYLKEHLPLKFVNTPEYNKLITQNGEHLSNSEENVQPINQDSTGVLQSSVALKQ